MSSLNGRITRLEKQLDDHMSLSQQRNSPFAEWFARLHKQINQVEDWDNPPLSCMGMRESRCYKWVINVPLWSYWCKKINEVNGREVLQTEYDSQAAAAAAFRLGADLVNQAYQQVISGKPDKT